MVDISKIQVGDEITVKAVVRETSEQGYVVRATAAGLCEGWFSQRDLVSHTPQPREIKVGDKVMWQFNDFQMQTVECLTDGWACIRRATYSRDEGPLTVVDLKDLRHAEP